MSKIEDFYILGESIETEIGDLSPIKVLEYPKFISDLSVMSLTKNYVIYHYSKMNKTGEMDELIEELKENSIFNIVEGIKEMRDSYDTLFKKSFGKQFDPTLIAKDNFESVRKIILEMNCTNESDASLNHEIQEAIERSRRVKNRQGDRVEFSDIISSVVAFSGIDYSIVKNWSIYQLYMTYSRISQFKNFDTSALFATVSTEKINIESWSKHINLIEKEDHGISMQEFNKSYGNLFK